MHVYMCATVGPGLRFLFLTGCFGLVCFFSVFLVYFFFYYVGVWGRLVTNATISPVGAWGMISAVCDVLFLPTYTHHGQYVSGMFATLEDRGPG